MTSDTPFVLRRLSLLLHERDKFFATIETAALESIGIAINLCTGDQYVNCCKELERRVEHSLHKAEVLYDYHTAAFKKSPSSKNWNELTAIMALVQHMVNES